MLKPRALGPGDRVALIAPASPFTREEFEEGLAELRALGFEPVFDDRVFSREAYLAGDAAVRAEIFMAAWEDPRIAGLIAIRGGYGSVHLLPAMSADLLRRTPKAFVGYSDLTTILSYLSIVCGIVCFHGPMLAGKLAKGEVAYDRDTFVRALTARAPLGELAPRGVECFHRGEASGPLFGGNLTQIAASLGTPFAFALPKGAVLFLEDVGERPYRLDRMLTQLWLAGMIQSASAVVFGEFPECDEPRGDPTARATIASLMRDFPGPVLYGFPSGHTAGPSLTLPLGVRMRVVAGPSSRLIVEEAAVE